MKQCSRCAQEIEPSATVCGYCGQPAVDPAADEADLVLEIDDDQLAAGPADRVSSAPVPTDQPAMPQTGGSRRKRHELLAIVIALMGCGTLAFGMLVSRGTVASDAPAARVDTRTPRPAPVKPADPAPTQKWHSPRRSRWVDGSRRSVAFELPAENRVPVWTRQVRPILVVRCMAGRTEAFVFTDTAAKIEPQDQDHTVGLAFDDDPEATERWPDSAEHDALFAPDGPSFTQKLIRARTIRFRFTPHNVPPVVARFHVEGLGEHIGPVARQCGR
ncbi:MAG TPA: hypothetical protein VLD67_08200 [Vicinamibacterales bacterium]|nr:hypothetical protein [Vicinamibacterales bacterium]